MKLMEIDSIALNSRSSNFRTALFDRPSPEPGLNERPTKVRGGYSPFDIFQWLSPEAETAFTQASRRRHFTDSRRIYSQSEPGNEMYRIVSGCVRMSVLRNDGREALHSVLGAGDCFGICSLLDGAPRHHTTSANGDVELQVLRRESCEFLRAQHASFADGLIRHMSRHTRLLSEYFVSSTLDELPCRVAMRLLKARKPSAIRGGKIGLTVHLSQSEIALMVGASRQAVNRVLKKFQDDGLINIEYGSVQVLDVEGLQSAT
jgi:CRP/FNR family transcriptional regulator, cyclic AMP receptor protein